MKKALAFDMGATSIRGITGYVEDGRLVTQEVMRIAHHIVEKDGRLRWEWDKLLYTIIRTILDNADEIDSIGFDTWGVDFGILDKDGELIDIPISYRDHQHEMGFKEVKEIMGEKEIFLNSGNQIMSINTLFQLLALRKLSPEKFEKMDTMLMMPDLLQYMLSGERVSEETIWSTSQMLNLIDNQISDTIFETLHLNKSIIPRAIRAGEITGNTKKSKIEKVSKFDIDVVSVCGHDTASAVLLTDSFKDEKCMFLSCGTWSLIGSVVGEGNAIVTENAFEDNLTNELGFASKAMFFKNLTGLYLLEKYKEQLEAELGLEIPFDDITSYVIESDKDFGIIDIENPVFGTEGIDAKAEIDAYLLAQYGKKPTAYMDYFKVIYESLVDKYFHVKKSLESVLGREYTSIHMIGGGAKSRLLCQMVANRLELPVKAGPFESSALGNIIIQLVAKKKVASVQEGIDIALKSEVIKMYEPRK